MLFGLYFPGQLYPWRLLLKNQPVSTLLVASFSFAVVWTLSEKSTHLNCWDHFLLLRLLRSGHEMQNSSGVALNLHAPKKRFRNVNSLFLFHKSVNPKKPSYNQRGYIQRCNLSLSKSWVERWNHFVSVSFLYITCV